MELALLSRGAPRRRPLPAPCLVVALAALLLAAPLHAAWSPPRVLELRGKNLGDELSLVARGEVLHLVWRADFEVRSARSSDCGDSWSPSRRIAGLRIGQPGAPGLAVDGDDLYVAWEDSQKRIPGDQVFFSRSRDSGRTWSRRVQLAEPGNQIEPPAVRVLDGTIHVAWSQYASRRSTRQGRVVVASSADRGVTWSSRAVARADRPGRVFLAAQPESGRLFLAYASLPGRLALWEGFLLVRWEADGAWTRPISLGIRPSRVNDLLTVGRSLHLLWRDASAIGDEPVTYLGSSVGPWPERLRLSSAATRSRPGSGRPSAALAGAGRTLIAAWESWSAEDRGKTESEGIFVTRSSNLGRTWRRPRLLVEAGRSPVLAISEARGRLCHGTAHLVFRTKGASGRDSDRPIAYSRGPARPE